MNVAPLMHKLASLVPIGFEDPKWLFTVALVALAFWVSAHSVAGMARWRRRLAMVLRTAALLAFCFALAGARLLKAQDSLCVLFVVDTSRSVGEGQRDLALAHIKAAAEGMRRGKDKMGVIVFGEDACLETTPSESPLVGKLESVASRDQTDIAQALRLALATFPEGSAKRMVLLSDGNETLGRALDEARLALANEVPIDVVKLHTPYEKEVAVDFVLLPQRVKVGEPFDLRIVLDSIAAGEGKLVVYRNRQLYGERAIKWGPGKNVFSLRQSIDDPGFATYEVTLVTADDTLVENNRAMGFTRVEGAPRVLLCTADTSGDAFLAGALRDGRMTVDVSGPSGIPTAMTDLVGYDAVIFSNIPAMAMRTNQMELIRAACRDLGIGFMMIGGENSFGLGGYYKTPIEETLPVSMDITHKEHFPSTSLVIAVDTSGSMAAVEGGKQKIEIACEGACMAAELLSPRDQLAVLSCDGGAHEVLPLANVGDINYIKKQIRTMRPGGGGIYVRPTLEKSYQILTSRQCEGQIMHVIVAADGADCDDQEGCEELARKYHDQYGITTTFISLGVAQDTPFEARCAAAGGGRMYEVRKMEDLPRIYTKETLLVARSLVCEEPFYPSVDPGAPPLRGIDWKSAPPLLGYVGTSEKPTSQLYMRTHKEDPLLAAWQFGLGRSVAFTSDAKNRWSADWLAWSAYPKFWQQVVRYMLRSPDDGSFESTVEVERGEGTITVEALGNGDEFVNYLDIRARLVAPDSSGRDLKLEQVAPGRYQQRFKARDVGAYMVNLSYQLPNGSQANQTAGAVVPYPEEFRRLDPDDFLLTRIAEVSGGEPLTYDDVSNTYRLARPRVRTPVPIWPALVLFGMLTFVVDIAVRRLAFDRRQWDLAREKLAEFRARIRRADQPQVEVDPTLGRLLLRKRTGPRRGLARASGQPEVVSAETAAPVGPAAVAEARGPADDPAERERLRQQLAAVMERRGAEPGPAAAAPEPSAGDTADTFSRLMSAKRRVQR